MNFLQKKAGLLIAGLFFIVGVFTLPHYGITWDTINHLLRGQAYLNYYLTGSEDYSNLPPVISYYQKEDTLFLKTDIEGNNFPRRSFYQMNGYTYQDLTSLSILTDVGHPPLGGIFSALGNFVFFQKLGLVNDVDSHHLYGLFLASVLVWLVFRWGKEKGSFFTGLIASLALVFYPLFLGESHFNTEKDIPEMALFSLVLFSFWKGITQKSWRWIIVSSLFCGLAFGTKWNIAFAPLIILPWLIIYYWPQIKSKKWPFDRKITLSFLFYPLIVLGIFFAGWPRFWSSPLAGFLETLDYYLGMGAGSSFNPRFLTTLKINTYPLQWISFTTPLITLFFFVIGVFFALKKGWREKHKKSLFFLIWFLVPIARVTIPKAGIYGGVRQIMEYIPAMALLAGTGANWLRQKLLKQKFLKLSPKPFFSLLVSFLLVFSFFPIVFKLASIHPHENVYFNPLIGGLAGAREKNIPAAGNTFGNGYRQGVSWINKNLPPDSKLAFAYELKSNIPNLWLRQDIEFTNLVRSGFLRQGEYVISVPYAHDDNLEKSYFGRYVKRFLNPVYEAKVDGVSVMMVWHNVESQTKPEYLVEEEIINPSMEIVEDEVLIDLKEKVFLSHLEFLLDERRCSDLKEGYFYLSKDGENWVKMPEVLPTEWAICVLGDQPQDGKIIYPFAAEEAQFIKFKVVPTNACAKKIRKTSVFTFPALQK